MWGYGCSSSGGAIMHSTKTNIVSSVRMARLVLLCIVASTCFRYASTQPSGESGDASGSGDDSTSNDDSGSGSDDDEPGIPLSTIPTQGALSTTPTAIAASTSRTGTPNGGTYGVERVNQCYIIFLIISNYCSWIAAETHGLVLLF